MTILLALACNGGPEPATEADLQLLEGARVAWVGAHPDDDYAVAMLLSPLCEQAECTQFVLTRGELGSCALDTCEPDVGAVRERELREAARLLGTDVEQLDWGDVDTTQPDAVITAWGGKQAAVADLQARLEAFAPDVVLTFDPRHGSTCNPAHQAAATVTLEAAAAAGVPSDKVFMIAHRFDAVCVDRIPQRVGFGPAVHDSLNHRISTVDTWNQLIDVLDAHASQFTPAFVDAFGGAGYEARAAWLQKVSDIQPDDERYEGYCDYGAPVCP